MLWLRGKVHRQRWVEVKFPGAVNMVDLSQVKAMLMIILRIVFEYLKTFISLKGPTERAGYPVGWKEKKKKSNRIWERVRWKPSTLMRYLNWLLYRLHKDVNCQDWYLISALQAFPWPAGKAPWLVENGGTGVVPNGALERFGMSRDFRQISMEENSESAGAYHALPAVENVPAPRNIQAHNTYMYLCGQIFRPILP